MDGKIVIVLGSRNISKPEYARMLKEHEEFAITLANESGNLELLEEINNSIAISVKIPKKVFKKNKWEAPYKFHK